jgi:nucleoside-diphosphate-sugar epimerase
MTTVLVTGASGFLGAHVVAELLARGYDVAALARSAAAAATIDERGARPVMGDLDDPASLDAAFAEAGADLFVNLASLGFGQAPAIVSAAAEVGLTRGVYVSSTAIFTTLNAASKPRRKAGEDTVTATALDWTIVRPTMIYGTPGDRNLARLLQVIGRVPVLPVPGGGSRLQQPVHVDDLAVAIVNALERPVSIRRAYNVAGPEAITFRELLEQAGAAMGRHPRLVPVPLGPTIAAMRLYERLAPHPRLKAEQLERLSEDKAFDISDARHDLGFAPRPFAEGIASEAALLAASGSG